MRLAINRIPIEPAAPDAAKIFWRNISKKARQFVHFLFFSKFPLPFLLTKSVKRDII